MVASLPSNSHAIGFGVGLFGHEIDFGYCMASNIPFLLLYYYYSTDYRYYNHFVITYYSTNYSYVKHFVTAILKMKIGGHKTLRKEE